MHQHDDHSQEPARPQTLTDTGGAYRAAAGHPGVPGLLSLQASAGNAAVGRLMSLPVQRLGEPPAGAAPPVVPGRPAPPSAALDDAKFNPTTRAHDLLRAVDSEQHTYRIKSSGLMGHQEDVEAERREIDFPAVVAALDGLTASQVKKVEEVYFDFEKLTTLRADLFEGGQSGRKADLTPDRIARLQVLLRGTKPEPIPPEVLAELSKYPPEIANKLKADLQDKADAGPALNRREADAIELHELLSDDLNEARRERIMTMFRRPMPEIEAVEALYAQKYGPDAINTDIEKRLEGLQRMRLAQLRMGNLAQADACAIEDKRRQIEELDKQDASFTTMPFGGYDYMREHRRKQRQELTGDIQGIIELNKQEALADPANAGRESGKAVAERLGKILNQQHGEVGNTLGAELGKTLAKEDAAVISALTDSWNLSGGASLVRAAATQLAADERAGTTSAKKIMATLRSFREVARQDLMAKAYDPLVPPEQKQAILSDGESAITRLAQRYIEQYREEYNKIAGDKGRDYDEIVASADSADEGLISSLSASGGQASELAELDHAMSKKDVEAVKALLRKQPDKKALDALVAGYENLGGDRDMRKQLFGSTFDGETVSPEMAQADSDLYFRRGMATKRDAAQLAELLARPDAGQAAEAKWITEAGLTEYSVTMAHRGWTGRLREVGDDPETQRLLERTRDDLVALGKQMETEQNPAKREALLREIRRLRSTLTGDADAYEKDNARVLGQIQSALSFAVSIALAIAIPGAGAGIAAFLQTTAINIAANVASNFVIKMGDYGLDDLKADVLGGLLGAGGAKFGEELLGRVAAAVVKPAADATAEVAGKLGVRTALAREAGSLVAAGERVVIKAEELEIKAAAGAATKTIWEKGAREVGGFAGGIYGPKVLTGDYSLSLEEVLKALAATAAGKMAHREKPGAVEENGPARDSDAPARDSEAPARESDGPAPDSGTPSPSFHPEPVPANADVFGPRSPRKMLLDNGIPLASGLGFQQVADVFNVVIKVRPTNTASLPVLEAGGVPKPELIKAKTVNRVDLLIGGPAGGEGKVGFFEPVMPSRQILDVMAPDVRRAVEQRHAQRAEEYAHYKQEYGKLAAEGMLRMKDGVLQIADPTTAATPDAPLGQFKDIGGDHDLFAITNSDGTPLHPDVRRGVINQLRSMGINVEHGDHSSWQADSPHTYDPGADAKIRGQHETSEPLVAFVPKSQPREVFAGDVVTGPVRKQGVGDRFLPAGKGKVVGSGEGSPMRGEGGPARQGSGSPDAVSHRMAAKILERSADWQKGSPDQRADLLVDIISLELVHTGVPVPVAVSVAGENSSFDPRTWKIEIGHPALDVANPDTVALAMAADHARHEIEHAVLEFRIARREARIQGETAAELAERLDIHEEVAAHAIRVNSAPGPYEPLEGTPLDTQAELINESLRGRGAKDRKKILDDLKDTTLALAGARHAAKDGDPTAVQDLRKAEEIYAEANQKYLDLPDEILAWEAGRRLRVAVNMQNGIRERIAEAEGVLADQRSSLTTAMAQSGADEAVRQLEASVAAAQKHLDELLARQAGWVGESR